MAMIIAVALVMMLRTAHAADAPQQITHTVIFWLKRPGNAGDRAAVIDASRELATLPGVVRVQAGEALPVRRPGVEQEFDVAAVFTFRDRASLRAFQADPRHVAAVQGVLKPLVRRYSVFDAAAR